MIVLGSRVLFYLHVLEQLLYLWVVFCSDLLIVEEVLQLALVVVELKSMAVKRVVTLMAANIVDRGGDGDHRSLNCFWLSNADWGVGRSIFTLFVEGKCRLNMMRFVEDVWLFC